MKINPKKQQWENNEIKEMGFVTETYKTINIAYLIL